MQADVLPQNMKELMKRVVIALVIGFVMQLPLIIATGWNFNDAPRIAANLATAGIVGGLAYIGFNWAVGVPLASSIIITTVLGSLKVNPFICLAICLLLFVASFMCFAALAKQTERVMMQSFMEAKFLLLVSGFRYHKGDRKEPLGLLQQLFIDEKLVKITCRVEWGEIPDDTDAAVLHRDGEKLCEIHIDQVVDLVDKITLIVMNLQDQHRLEQGFYIVDKAFGDTLASKKQ